MALSDTGGPSAGPGDAMHEAAAFDAVRNSLALVMPEVPAASVSIDAALADLGCTSIDRADIVMLAMEALGVTVPVREFDGVRNIRALVAVLARHL